MGLLINKEQTLYINKKTQNSIKEEDKRNMSKKAKKDKNSNQNNRHTKKHKETDVKTKRTIPKNQEMNILKKKVKRSKNMSGIEARSQLIQLSQKFLKKINYLQNPQKMSL